ncbi:hypothetical protein P154DRAFT_522411 [Amniculicola lignicola CBS 123094]|uniref:Uncharacterized protein n=1 Tax=Amniculicola lignicola CBS 123094 TaxID=1392246 RepID=A0A6A5WF33_9PLEO|nr:hypothetical protein P154DRAFT_522411 [Amniculicola lignicola CBS 123094]
MPLTLPRTPLASLVCPSTPFLAPRLLRPTAAPAAWASTRTGHQRPAYATHAQATPTTSAYKKVLKGQKRRDERKAAAKARVVAKQLGGEGAPLLGQLRAALHARDYGQVVSLYPAIVQEQVPIAPRDTAQIAGLMHARLRHASVTERSSMLPLVDRFVHDIREGRLPPHHAANVHLLGIFKECGEYERGYLFWTWLAERDDTHLNAAVFGAAIELLAYRGKNIGLPALEAIYTHALKRFPGTFAEYHLSPDAIVPDRTQAVRIPGISITLLQGIITARLLFRDWRNAYLGLDTALRLYPAQVPPRIFEVFMVERPLSEAYTVFLLACRSGVTLNATHLTTLLNELLKAMKPMTSLKDRIDVLKRMANALYAFQEARGTLSHHHIGGFINAFGFLLPETPIEEEAVADEAALKNIIALRAHKTLADILLAGMLPMPQHITAVMNVAGNYKSRKLFDTLMEEAQTLNVSFGPVTNRIALTNAGKLQARGWVEHFWALIASDAESSGTIISREDWLTLARACRRAGLKAYFDEQLFTFQHAIDSKSREDAQLSWETPMYTRTTSITLMSLEDLENEMEQLQIQLENISVVLMSGQPLDLRKTPFDMFVDPLRRSIGPVSALKTVYDELTTDPHQPPPPSGTNTPTISVSPTGIPLDELRFKNWVVVIELMSEAEETHKSFQRRINEALANMRSVAKRGEKLFNRREEQEQDHPEQSLDDLRITIKRLRSGQSTSAGSSQQGPSISVHQSTPAAIQPTIRTTSSSSIFQPPSCTLVSGSRGYSTFGAKQDPNTHLPVIRRLETDKEVAFTPRERKFPTARPKTLRIIKWKTNNKRVLREDRDPDMSPMSRKVIKDNKPDDYIKKPISRPLIRRHVSFEGTGNPALEPNVENAFRKTKIEPGHEAVVKKTLGPKKDTFGRIVREEDGGMPVKQDRIPTLEYYVGLKSDHGAPAPSSYSLSQRPLKLGRKEKILEPVGGAYGPDVARWVLRQQKAGDLKEGEEKE